MSPAPSMSDRFSAWWSRSWWPVLIAGLFWLAFFAGWMARGSETVVVGRCPASGSALLIREGGDFVVRCER